MDKTSPEIPMGSASKSSPTKKSFPHKLVAFLLFAGLIYLFFTSYKELLQINIDTAFQTRRASPVATAFTASYPIQTLLYSCDKASYALVNTAILRGEELNKLCETGYEIKLKDGENNIKVQIHFSDESYNTFSEEFKILFSQASYENKLKNYADQYCKNRKNSSREYGKVTFNEGIKYFDPTKGKIGKNLSKSNCEALVKVSMEIMQISKPEINDSDMKDIINRKFYIGMDQFLFYASVGNPSEVNKSTYENSQSDQVIYYKDSNHISANYFYFNDGVLTSYQEF